MNFNDALTILREDYLNDTVEDYLWSNKALMRLYNRAINEACERAALLRGSRSYTLADGTVSLTLPDEVIHITEARLVTNGDTVRQVSEQEMLDRYGPTWFIDEGTPRYFIRHNKAITLYPISDIADTLTFYHTRRPLDSELIYAYTDEPPIDEQYHYPLIYGVAHLAYLRPDIDTFNPARSAEMAALFDRAFGIRHSAARDEFARNTPLHMTVNARRFV